MSKSYSFLGVIDDKVKQFPWKFKIENDYVNLSLLNSLITGSPVIINDGHLLLHELGIGALMNKKSLFWHLIDNNFIHVMNRGGNNYGIDELPYKMAKEIPTYSNLLKYGSSGFKWSELKKKLSVVDLQLRLNGQYIDFPPYNTGSGFLELSKRFLKNNTSSQSAGLDNVITDLFFSDFVKRFIELMNADLSAPRTKWEKLAMEMADKTQNSLLVSQNLMNLANEMYHYNMGIMLSSQLDAEIAVETQTSDAFDDLLLSKDIMVQEFKKMPTLNIPRQLLNVDPKKLMKILDPTSKIGIAKKEYLKVKEQYVTPSDWYYGEYIKELRYAMKEYSHQLSENYGKDFRFPVSESLINFALSSTFGMISGELLGENPIYGAVAGSIMGYGLSVLQNKTYNKVTEKYRVFYADHEMLKNKYLVNKSQAIINRIKGRKIPSLIQIDKNVAQGIASRMSPYLIN